jgi:hypothetical protein
MSVSDAKTHHDRRKSMRLTKIGGLALAAAATLAIGSSPALAAPHHGKSHKVCKTSWHNHHKVTKCHWERR